MTHELIIEWHRECLEYGNHEWEDFLISQVKQNRELIHKMINTTNIEIVTLREHNMKAQERIEKLTIKLIEAEKNLETPGN